MTHTFIVRLGAGLGAILLLLSAQWASAAPGELDLTFGNGTGKVTTLIGNGNDLGWSVLMQEDGKILVAGQSQQNGPYEDCVLVRYRTNGTLDTDFNGSGIVTTDIGNGHNAGRSAAIQSDGKIVVVGNYYSVSGGYDFALVRYQSNGAPDLSFNGTGQVTTAIGGSNEFGFGVAVQNDGKIIVAGDSHNGSSYDFAVVRYNPNGTLDTGFNGTGKVTTDIGNDWDAGYSVAVQSDGKILVAGESQNGSNRDFALVRYNATGTLDTSFNGTGKVTTDIGNGPDSGRSVAILSDGKIVVAGYSHIGSSDVFALVRYHLNGTLDTSFNGTGIVTTAISSGTDFGWSMAIQSDGKILVAGESNYDFALVRYHPNGMLETSFNGSGKVTTDISNRDDYGRSVAIQNDGKIIVAGYFRSASSYYDLALVRYNGDGFAVPPPSETVLVPFDSTWTWQHPTNGTDPGATFQANWMKSTGPALPNTGAGLFGYGGYDWAIPATDIGTPASGQRYTAYFKKTFSVPASMTGVFFAHLLCDDGSIVYLDGNRVGHFNHPGADTYTSPATALADETQLVTIPLSITSLGAGNPHDCGVRPQSELR